LVNESLLPTIDSVRAPVTPAKWIFSGGMSTDDQAPSDDPDQGEGTSSGRPVVALLEDDLPLLETVAEALSAFGLDVHAFADPETLMSALGRQTFDAYVIDWRLGERTAAQTIYALRAMPDYALTPVFILSGNIPVVDTDWDRDMANLLAQHEVQYRAKPYRSRELAAEIISSIRDNEQGH
jgi:DNA-binding response OmpR family regulator